jgi:cellulose synthase/poly-beta-1,6-N-acetylglucosamine synthase-like glycosyltransferase
MTAFAISVFLVVLTLVYMLFLARILQGLGHLAGGKHKPANEIDTGLPFVSVLVAMRNEEQVIGQCVAALRAQDYPAGSCEFILVDDGSTDGTIDAATRASLGDDRFTIVPNSGRPGKKGALRSGVERARGDVVLTTDADCLPKPGWIRAMAAHFEPGTGIVSGPVVFEERGAGTVRGIQGPPYCDTKSACHPSMNSGHACSGQVLSLSNRGTPGHPSTGLRVTLQPQSSQDRVSPDQNDTSILKNSTRHSLFHRLQSLEFLSLVGVGAGFIGIDAPRICNGANLAYRRDAFFEAGGYNGNEQIASGDDEFLMHAIVYRLGLRAVFAASPEAIVSTAPADSLSAFLSQRSRWASKTIHRDDRAFVAFLALIFFYFVLLVAAPWLILHDAGALVLYALLFVTKSFFESSVVMRTAQLLRQPVRLIDFPIAFILHPPYILISTITGILGRTKWKDRTT